MAGAQAAGIRYRLVERTVEELSGRLPELARRSAEAFRLEYGESAVIARILQYIDERVRRIRLLLRGRSGVAMIFAGARVDQPSA